MRMDDSTRWCIFDWAGNKPFGDFYFNSFDAAEEFLSEHLILHGNYETDRQEYEICLEQGDLE